MNSQKVLIYVLIGILLAGIVLGAIFYFSFMKTSNPVAAEEELILEYSLDEFTTNLGSQRTYFKGTIVVVTNSQIVFDQFESKRSEMRDSVFQILIAKSVNDILDQDGQAVLRSEIKEVVSRIMNTDKITQVYFTDYIVQ